MTVEAPFQITQRCLAFVTPDDEREDRLGDLAEAYAQDVLRVGEREAGRRRRHIWSCILSAASRRAAGLLQNQALPATAAVLIALTGYASLVRATAETWWIKSGFERNPGYFISANPIDYPLCGNGAEQGRHVAEARDHVLLLPRKARIYCRVAPIRFSDDNYTKGRVLTAAVRFQVVWEE